MNHFPSDLQWAVRMNPFFELLLQSVTMVIQRSCPASLRCSLLEKARKQQSSQGTVCEQLWLL